MSECPVTITNSALEQVKMLKNGANFQGNKLRFGIDGEGCAGFYYVFDLVDDSNDNDELFKLDDEITLVIDKDSLLNLQGAIVDYANNSNGFGFVINNPNERKKDCGGCSCG